MDDILRAKGNMFTCILFTWQDNPSYPSGQMHSSTLVALTPLPVEGRLAVSRVTSPILNIQIGYIYLKHMSVVLSRPEMGKVQPARWIRVGCRHSWEFFNLQDFWKNNKFEYMFSNIYEAK